MAKTDDRLKEKYEKEVRDKLAKEFDIKNLYAVPKIKKVVVNAGVGEASGDKGLMDSFREDFSLITGQTPAIQLARVSVASFGVRQGQPVGLKATLRGKRMYNFLDKLFSITLPRLRDFRGLSREAFDEFGNYTLGLSEHTVFPDLDLSKAAKPFGLEITIVTSAKERQKAEKLLEYLGMPFEKKE